MVEKGAFRDVRHRRPQRGAFTALILSERELDQYQSLEEQASAKLMLATVQLESAMLHLDWTKVTSPIDGRISRYYLTPGNLIHKDLTKLTAVVSIDPMYVHFDMDERTLLRIKRIVNEGQFAGAKQSDVPVRFARPCRCSRT